jgi:protein TonB
MAKKKEKNKSIALLYTFGVHAVVVLLMFFVVAFRLPNPPLPDSGMLINLGFDDQGSGDVQPEEPVGSEKKQEATTQETKPEEKIQEEPQEEKQTARPVEDKAADEDLLTSKEESPVVVKEKKEEIKPVEKPKEEPKKEEPKKEPKKEEPKKENPIAVYKPATKSETNTTGGDGREGKAGNQGDDKGKAGDKGNPNGVTGSDIYTGKPGGGGDGVSMSGFKGFDWPSVQTPTLPDEAYGVYEFIVKVDADGTVTKVEPVQRGLSLEAERKLRAIIQQLEFTPKGINLPPESEGRITFKVVSK